MRMPPRLRRLVLTAHVVGSGGWIGAVVAYLILGVAAANSREMPTVRAAWIAMDLIGWYAIVPLAIAALTTFSVIILLLHLPGVSALAHRAREADGAELAGFGDDLAHPGVGLLLLLAITTLNVYKPRGLTPYGRRKQREQQATGQS